MTEINDHFIIWLKYVFSSLSEHICHTANAAAALNKFDFSHKVFKHLKQV